MQFVLVRARMLLSGSYRRFGFYIGMKAEAFRLWRARFIKETRYERIHHEIRQRKKMNP